MGTIRVDGPLVGWFKGVDRRVAGGAQAARASVRERRRVHHGVRRLLELLGGDREDAAVRPELGAE